MQQEHLLENGGSEKNVSRHVTLLRLSSYLLERSHTAGSIVSINEPSSAIKD
jgi:hypothetical protein